MADIPTSILPDCNTLEISDSEVSAPTLMSLPVEVLDQIVTYLLPDQPVLRLRRGWAGRLEGDEEDLIKIGERLSNSTGDFELWAEHTGHPWQYDEEFRCDKERVQTAILGVNRCFYNIGCRLLYGRTLKVDLWASSGYGLYDQRTVYLKLRNLPLAKMQRILIIVHAASLMEDVAHLRRQLLILCEFLVSSGPSIKNLSVVYSGEWNPDEIMPPLVWTSHNIHRHPRPRPRDWTISEVEHLSVMLEPLRQLVRVQECEIQLPGSVLGNVRLAGEVDRCLRDIKDEQTAVEAELPEDWEEQLFLDWVEKDLEAPYVDPSYRDCRP